MFSVCFRHHLSHHRNNFSFSHQNRLCLILNIWDTKESIGLGKCTAWPFHDLDPRSCMWHWLTKICLYAQLSEDHSSNLQNLVATSPTGSHADYLKFWRNYVINSFCGNSFSKFQMYFFKVKLSINHISGMVGPTDMKQKGSGSVGYWINWLTLTFDIPPWPWIFKVTFWNSSLHIRNCWCDWKQTNWILGQLCDLSHWPHSWPWPWFFKVKILNSLISGIGGPINVEQKGYSSIMIWYYYLSHIHNDDMTDHLFHIYKTIVTCHFITINI